MCRTEFLKMTTEDNIGNPKNVYFSNLAEQATQ